ncbi:MAG: hypothetical protein AAGL89_09245 [Pseudomonadota bacterium]
MEQSQAPLINSACFSSSDSQAATTRRAVRAKDVVLTIEANPITKSANAIGDTYILIGHTVVPEEDVIGFLDCMTSAEISFARCVAECAIKLINLFFQPIITVSIVAPERVRYRCFKDWIEGRCSRLRHESEPGDDYKQQYKKVIL